MNANAVIILDSRRQKSDSTYPIKLKLTYLRKRKYYSVDVDLTIEDWKKITAGNPRKDLLKIKHLVNEIEVKANKTIQDLPIFSFEKFEKAFFSNKSKTNVYDAFQDYIDALTNEGRISTANAHKNTLNSLKNYRAQLTFVDVSVDFLKDYEAYMLNKGVGFTTIGIYLRNLRIIYNVAIEEGSISKEYYPFGKRKYKIPTGKNVKKALALEEIEKLYNYKPEPGSFEDRAKDFWFLSYYCNGANMKDLLRLKYEDIQEDQLTFRRAKTENSQRDGKVVTVILNTEAQYIIKKWRAVRKNKGFLFPILDESLSPEREYAIKNQFIKTVNNGMKKIAVKVGIDKEITTYTARHSFSTVLKRSGASIEFISESLGHADLRTTENYLGSFGDDMKRKYASVLTQFTTVH